MRLILVPHALTDWNVQGRYQGHSDRPLSEAGQRQAECLQRALAETRFDSAFASDLRRARETAAAITEPRGLTVQADARLRELHFGEWEGLTYEEIQREQIDALAAWMADVKHKSAPGGETAQQMAERVGSFLASLEPLIETEETTLLVAHRGSLRMLLCLVLGLEPQARWQFQLEPASISELELHAGTAILVRWNDTHHLQEALHAG
jgi:alpha-ribazole phosphatase